MKSYIHHLSVSVKHIFQRLFRPTFVAVAVIFFFAYPHTAFAAISFVGSCENSAANGADVTLTLPSMQQGDLVIISYSISGIEDPDFNMAMVTSGYTEVADLFADDISETHLGVYWKIMGASPDATAVVDGSSDITVATAAVCMVFRGVDATTPMDVTPTTSSTINTRYPDPPSLNHNNPSGVWTVIAGGNVHTHGASTSYTFPTGYTTNAVDITGDDSFDTTLGMGYRSSGVSDPEDPGAMTFSAGNNVDESSAAVTIALRPISLSPPTVTTTAGATAGVGSASVTSNITATGGENSTGRGFAFGTNSGLTGAVSTTTESGSFSTGAFTHDLSGLLAGITYYYRAYGTNSAGTGYGSIESFTTGTNTTPSRTLRLFEGFKIRFVSGKIILHQK